MAPAGDMFQCKIDEFFKELPNVFGIANNIEIVGNDADDRDCDRALTGVMQIWHKENLQLNKSKCTSYIIYFLVVWNVWSQKHLHSLFFNFHVRHFKFTQTPTAYYKINIHIPFCSFVITFLLHRQYIAVHWFLKDMCNNVGSICSLQ